MFKGAECKEAVIRCITYDLLFNNMKSIVVKTSSKYTATPYVVIILICYPPC